MELDFFSQKLIDDPYPIYKKFRETAPICYVENAKSWFLTKQLDIFDVMRSDRFGRRYEEFQILKMGPQVVEEPYFRMARETVLFTDPPKHRPLRKVLGQRFGRQRAAEFRPTIETIVHDVIDTFIHDGETDLSATLAEQVPLRVISAIMGVPLSDQPQLADWLEAWGYTLGITPMTPAQLEAANAAAIGFEDYFREMIRQRTAQPGEDFISEMLAYSRSLETPFDEYTLVSNMMLLYFGGQDTQQKQLGIIVEMLDNWPDQLAWLKEDPARVWTCMGELMRYDPVGQFSNRIALDDVQIGDVHFQSGDSLLLCWGAGNRDPEVYDQPDVLDLQRKRGEQERHLSFGAGAHACAGSSFALTTIPMMLQAMFQRMPDYQIDRDRLVRRQSSVLRGFEVLPITWNAQDAKMRP